MKINKRIDLVNQLLTLKRYCLFARSEYEESGDTRIEVEEYEKGKFVKFKDIKKIVRDLKKADGRDN